MIVFYPCQAIYLNKLNIIEPTIFDRLLQMF